MARDHLLPARRVHRCALSRFAVPSSIEAARGIAGMTGKETIVVIDDDDAVRDSLQSLLETAGFSVRLHGSAEEFIAHCPSSERGCLLLDVQMPNMDGLTLQEKVATGWPQLAVVVMT